jgi:hypothetical protein
MSNETSNLLKKDILDNMFVEERKDEFKSKFRLYRAIKEIAEFEKNGWCGDSQIIEKSIICTLIPVYGWIKGFAVLLPERIEMENLWSNNSIRLKNILQKCMIGNSEKTLEEIIKKRNILSIIEHYVEFSGSKFGKKFLEKCQKNKYVGILDDKKDLFDTAFNLYQKFTNIGIANKDTYLKYPFVTKLVENKDVEISKIINNCITKVKDGLKNITEPITTVTTETNAEGKKKTTTVKKAIYENKEITETIIEDFDGKITKKIEEKILGSNLNFSGAMNNIANQIV